MIKKHRNIVLGIIILLLIIISFSWLILLPSKIDGFNFASNEIANIGTAISGLSTPILTLFSSLLLYIALTKQIESNDTQKLKNDVDFIFSLYNQLETEYNNLKYIVRGRRITKGATERYETIHDGYDGLYALGHFFFNNPLRFSVDSNTDKIKSIINSYLLVSKTLENIKLDNEIKLILEGKIESFYFIKLRDPLKILCFGIRDNKDLNSRYVLDFFLSKENEINSDFDLAAIKNIQEMFPADEYQPDRSSPLYTGQ